MTHSELIRVSHATHSLLLSLQYCHPRMIPPWHPLVLLVLQFDGSLRPPRDAGFPTQKLGRLGSCSAAILSDDGQQVLAIGGQTLPLVPGMTSADAEFEGLLLGLRYLCDHQELSNISDDDTLLLLVQGDCKTVIDQMSGDSQPRKLKAKYETAMGLCSQLNFGNVQFEHIMRDSNTLCDSICAHVMDIAVEREVSDMKASTESQSVVDILAHYYGDDNSIIPFSQRLCLYNEMLFRARETRDGLGLQQLGSQLEQDAKLWPTSSDVPPCKQSLSILASRIQIEGYELLGNKKELSKSRRKHRFVLDKHAAQSEIDLLGLESSSADSIMPSTPISEAAVEGDEFMVAWQQEARAIFLSGESMRKETRNVWVTL